MIVHDIIYIYYTYVYTYIYIYIYLHNHVIHRYVSILKIHDNHL